MKTTQKSCIPVEIFDAAERTTIAEVERLGLKPHVDEDGRLRGVWGPSGYKRTEVGVVAMNASQGFFRHGALDDDVDIVILTNNAGDFWLATADEVRA